MNLMSDYDILLLGSNGQIGSKLALLLTNIGKLYSPSSENFDKNSIESIIKLLNEIKPKIIVNTLAYTNVELAEDEIDYCDYLNHLVPLNISNWCKINNCFLIHYSSDYVFNVEGENPILENEFQKPINIYGKTKSKGDEAINHSGCNCLILRCSWIYSLTHNSFLKTLIEKNKIDHKINIVSDQIGTPTPASWIAEITCKLIKLDKLNKGFNVINCVPSGYISWYEFAKQIIYILRKFDYEIKLNEIVPIQSNAFNFKAKRPKNSRLDNKKLSRTLSMPIQCWNKLLLNEIKNYHQ
jgi:dTDP-4-dehydrorhamnose reductase